MPLFTPVYSKEEPRGHLDIIETKESYVGRVLETYEENGYHDSDFYAVVWDDETESYHAIVLSSTGQLAQDPDNEEQEWATQFQEILPVEVNEKVDEAVVFEWATDSDGQPKSVDVGNVSLDALKAKIADSRFSMSVKIGESVDSLSGVDHPTNLGDGPLDFIAETARDLVWQPLGISVTLQFMLLGVMFGSIMGGCQGLSRSLFCLLYTSDAADE